MLKQLTFLEGYISLDTLILAEFSSINAEGFSYISHCKTSAFIFGVKWLSLFTVYTLKVKQVYTLL